jgi:hypothetical protein
MIECLVNLLGARSARAGYERQLVVSLSLLFILVPLAREELFPFSRFPMFSDAPVSLVISSGYDGTGQRVSLDDLGIQHIAVANRRPLLNISPQRSFDAAYRFWEPREFAPMIQGTIASGNIKAPVRFEQELVGPVQSNGRKTVDIVGRRRWLVHEHSVELELP